MEGQKAKAVDVSVLTSYNWDCPRCNAFNKRNVGVGEDVDILACEHCGAQIKYLWHPVNDWVFEEK